MNVSIGSLNKAHLLAIVIVALFQAAYANAAGPLEYHRSAVRGGAMETLSFAGPIVARLAGNGLRIGIESSTLARAGVQSLDLVEVIAGAQSVRARVIRASLAPVLLASGAETSPDTEASVGLVVTDHGVDGPIELVGIDGVEPLTNVDLGMPIEIRIRRYRVDSAMRGSNK